ncbi:hypothetical protein C7S15_8321 [Burkholderia cepacia]|nr:hypothetical protein [Burkholderia cepacia]
MERPLANRRPSIGITRSPRNLHARPECCRFLFAADAVAYVGRSLRPAERSFVELLPWKKRHEPAALSGRRCRGNQPGR